MESIAKMNLFFSRQVRKTMKTLVKLLIKLLTEMQTKKNLELLATNNLSKPLKMPGSGRKSTQTQLISQIVKSQKSLTIVILMAMILPVTLGTKVSVAHAILFL